MALDRLELEVKAYAAYQRAIDAIRECQVAFQNAALPIPDRVQRFLDEASPATSDHVRATTPPVLPPPPAPQLPAEARPEWIWLPAGSALSSSLVIALVRRAGAPIRPAQICEQAAAFRKEPLSIGVIANIGMRLGKAGQILRSEAGWELADPSTAPLLYESHLWGPATAFDKYDLAEHRRIGILHVLRMHPEGLQVMQLTRMLERCDWLRAPLSKDLVKADLSRLDADNRAKRIGNSGKWKAASNGG